jgi:hypothetical protein
MSRSFSITGWRRELEKRGFRRDPDIRGAYSRMAGPRKLLVSKSHFSGSSPGVVIALEIGMPYEGEEGGWTIILSGFLRRHSIPVSFDFGVGDEWGLGESEQALAAVVQYGLPWLEEYSRPDKLIEYYETCLRHGIRGRSPNLPPIFKTMAKYSDRVPDIIVRRPPIYHWYLSQLYREVGDMKSSRGHAERYLKTLQNADFQREERVRVMQLIEEIDRCSR